LAEVFTFVEEARNLQEITPPWLDFRVVEAPTSLLAQGDRVTYRLRLLGVPFSWESVLERFRTGVGFVDTQVRGPYALWTHTHFFREVEGGVLMEDRVDYELPLFPLGEVALPAVRRQLESIFDYRKERMAVLFGDG
jgi:ligand-binding SRPBCC domain-containing protein